MLIGPQNLPERVHEVQERLAAAAARAGRSAHSVTLLAASKGQPPEVLRAAAACGLEHFGESYLQEALPKLDALRDRALTWHFIGQIQANKTRPIAEHFAWVHAVDRLRIAERLAAQRPHYAPPLNVCLQVHIGGEASKGGVEAGAAAGAGARRGVAAAPEAARSDVHPARRKLRCQRQRGWFRELRELCAALNSQGLELDTLSMGMSGDFEAAIEEGATLVRVGTALFGPRPP